MTKRVFQMTPLKGNYVIDLTGSNFSRQLDEISALHLALASDLFASFRSFKYRNDSSTSEQTIRNFQVFLEEIRNKMDELE